MPVLKSENKILLFNPRSASSKHRIPNSILQVGASVNDKYDVSYVDGNKEKDPLSKIEAFLNTGSYKYFGCTVMPGPQLKEAIPITKSVRRNFPKIKIVWGGYFPANQYKAVLDSDFVDAVINGSGDRAFLELIDAWEAGDDISKIKNLIAKIDGKIIKTEKAAIPDQDSLPKLPYEEFDSFYPIKSYLAKTFLGEKTFAYHSSFGCPFACAFCAVVPIYQSAWKGKSAERMYQDIKYLKDTYGIDSIEFHDNNFFASRRRVVGFSKRIKGEHITWWGEGRIDTLDKYSDEDLQLMSDAGCRMIFLGAETGSDKLLQQMNKGGKQTAQQIIDFAVRLRKFNIVPEYSFVLGLPDSNPKEVIRQIMKDIAFIKTVKRHNPMTEIIIYLYSPVPTQGSELYEQITQAGFKFPETLDDWLTPAWEAFDLRKNPLTPWLTPKMIDTIRNFETVLNGMYPTNSDTKLSVFQRIILRFFSFWRYKTGFYSMPYEIKLLQKILKYRQPEIEGF